MFGFDYYFLVSKIAERYGGHKVQASKWSLVVIVETFLFPIMLQAASEICLWPNDRISVGSTPAYYVSDSSLVQSFVNSFSSVGEYGESI